MLKLKLIRGGKKHKPLYNIGIMQATTKLKGLIIKKIGFYNPKTNDFKIFINSIINNLKCGVQPTTKIKFILINSKIIYNK